MSAKIAASSVPGTPYSAHGGHHEGGKSAQIPRFCGRQFGSRILDRVHRTAPMVRPRTMQRNGRI
jgi:hypothetical protein